jgi:hypothetical protein
MTSPLYLYVVLSVFWLFTGLWLGQKLEAHRWRSNASSPMRLESGDQLYKVTRE